MAIGGLGPMLPEAVERELARSEAARDFWDTLLWQKREL